MLICKWVRKLAYARNKNKLEEGWFQNIQTGMKPYFDRRWEQFRSSGQKPDANRCSLNQVGGVLEIKNGFNILFILQNEAGRGVLV